MGGPPRLRRPWRGGRSAPALGASRTLHASGRGAARALLSKATRQAKTRRLRAHRGLALPRCCYCCALLGWCGAPPTRAAAATLGTRGTRRSVSTLVMATLVMQVAPPASGVVRVGLEHASKNHLSYVISRNQHPLLFVDCPAKSVCVACVRKCVCALSGMCARSLECGTHPLWHTRRHDTRVQANPKLSHAPCEKEEIHTATVWCEPCLIRGEVLLVFQ